VTTTLRKFRSEATYVDGEEFGREFELPVPDGIDDDALGELLFDQTGFGHFAEDGSSLDAYYEITSIDGLEPEINLNWGG
jgi:hypothetical protein